jgi:signal transduction histidine kinase
MKVGKNLFTSVNEYLKRQSNQFLLIWGLILVLFVGVVDYVTGQELSFSIFYLLPISFVAWYTNSKSGVFMCLISSAIEFVVNSVTGRTYSHYLISCWNSAVMLGFFLISVFILSTLKIEYERRIKLIKELKDSLAELNRTKEELEQTSQDLARSNDDLKQFAYSASHDLQEPLRVVAGYVNLLARRYKDKLDANADEFIGYIVDGVKRMQELIKDLLEYSQVGIKEKHFKPVESSLAVGLAIGNLQATIEEYGAIVTYDELPTVIADFSQMSRLFQNLIGNAIKFRGNESPKVHISAERNGNEWIFSIKDNGIGIDPKNVKRIFVIFQRLHGREEYPGTGIGLATCKKIVERHGGRIWVESESGKGSIFYFTIPKEK